MDAATTPEIMLELIHVGEQSGVITLDLIITEELIAESGAAIPAGQPFALDVVAAHDGSVDAAATTLRRWCVGPDPVLAAFGGWEKHDQVLVLAHDKERVLVKFC